ncbi:diguanylate cyclase (GGDEF) domain-containing protein [Lachnospiraceae bacterium]|nr:diguanylate cyclase (GGDEF) domain-containing protein [Lachnospiraceae bacterium]
MTEQERIFNKIAEALLVDYSSVYYVNAVTNEYYWYSVNPQFHSLSLEQGGDDFFKNIIRDCKKVIYEEDQHIFIEDIQKENLISAMKKGTMQSIEYRLMIDGVPTWHALRLIRGLDEHGDYFVLGVINIDEEYHRRKQAEETAREKEVYDQIASSLAGQYDTLYYIDIETSTYVEVSSTDDYKKLNVPATGKDFFAESRRSIRKYVHPEDQDAAMKFHYKDVMLKNLQNRNSFSASYRLVVDGQVRHIRHSEIMARDKKHIIVCVENIDAEVQTKLALKESQKKSITYTQIAESLASHYDIIYYINLRNSHYMEFSTHKLYGELEIQEEGEDFFEVALQNVDRIIFPEDRERMKLFLDKDNFITCLGDKKQLIEDYRMVVDGGHPQYTRMTVMWSSDRSHFIMCIENREEDVRKEKEHLQALSMANEMARRDGLTGTRNKTAYKEMEKELQIQIDEGDGSPFGIVICDINDLKLINDTEGHKAGDEYIKAACKMVCRIYSHSPVFRVGGDEFAVILRGQDFENREELISSLRKQVENHVNLGEGAVVASGMAEFQPLKDNTVEDVFIRADGRMYEDKTRIKERKLIKESHALKEQASFKTITEDRRKLLDSLYKSFEIVAEGTYVYLCDMKFDYSRWSKSAVDAYGLPSEYMYGAGDIWENHIHPKDRDAYHKGVDEIFSGNAAAHDMQYRARRTDGEYDVCTCRGVVIRDLNGEPDYFAGTIRNHGAQGHIDTLTGLRNQYGFFEDLDICIRRKSEINVLQVGISKFSEINEMYGYHFGNRVLQAFARKVFETTGNTGHTYRIDGTKFAIISNTLSVTEMLEKYRGFRSFFREEFQLDNKRILLDVNCGVLKVDHFDIDSQTVYACLNFAYGESKIRKQGDMVVFHDELNEDNRQRLEKLHAIRGSIMHGYKGFFLMYQPVVDAKTERLISAEALLRWKNKTFGMVPPDMFIPLLESDPLFPKLGEWILREAVISAKRILKDNPDFIINVNLSYTQLEKPDFADMVLRILDELGYPPEHLCLEVTERCRFLDMELLKNVLSNLKARGILIALDDFGTGFSSMGIVKDIPFDIIKIDRSFVQKIEEDAVEREIIKNFSSLASIFGAKVCVEGIETEGMKEILQEFKVESFQGYYYAKPLEIEKFLDWNSNRK